MSAIIDVATQIERRAHSTVTVERKACPACESGDATTLFRAAFSDGKIIKFIERKFENPAAVIELLTDAEYELRRCGSCDLIYQRNILSDEYTAKLYDEWLLEEDAEHELSKKTLPPRQHAYFANELMMIGRLSGRPHHRLKVLDYGLGRGWWCLMAQAMGFEAYGTDLSNGLVSEARRKGINAIDFDEIAHHRFDFINTEQVFEHLSRPLEVLSRLKALLNPGGIIKISVPEGRDVEKRIPLMDWTAPRDNKRFLLPATPLIHINTFTRRSIKVMGRCAGFSPLAVPLAYEYSLLDGSSLRALAKSVLRPLYRRAMGATYVFLRNAEA